jgi:hypothetical protein
VVAGADRDALNLGLHRPSLREFAEHTYEDTRDTLLSGQARVERYLKEMEVSGRFFEAMMRVPPDEIRMLDWINATALIAGLPADRELIEERYERPDFQFSPSAYDWLRPKCSQFESDDRQGLGDCLREELQKESIRRAKQAIP